jgi:cytochrome c nitrite reductase small subunit
MSRVTPGRRRWMLGLVLAGLLGTTGGIGGYTFVYARGASYMGNDPATCANCHVMQDHLDAWVKSTHRAVATCNDCHAPHDIVGKYATKARNGLLHSIAFTSGNFPDPLRIKPFNLRVTEENCRHCHAGLVMELDHGGARAEDRLECTRCHDEVGHPRR